MFAFPLALAIAWAARILGHDVSHTERLILALDPGVQDAREIADAIDAEVAASGPVFAGKRGRIRTVRALVFTMLQETGFRRFVRGDRGRSKCLLQVWGAPDEAETDLRLCVRLGLAIMRWSIRACPKFPLANYASGTRGCSSPVAQRISNQRMVFANQ